jgi:L-rhamnose mutarotase
MKKLLLMLVVFVYGFTQVQAQSKPVYYLVSYYKTDRDKTEEYLNLMKNYASKIWKEKVKAGDVTSYSLYSVVSTSEDGGYNVISVQAANSINDFSKSNTMDLFKKAMPGIDEKTLTAITKSFTSIRTVVKYEIYRGIDGIGGGDQPYHEMNFMKANEGQENEYVRQEREIYKPIHQEFIKNGNRTGWGFSQLISPLADGSKYNYVTSNAFNDWDKSYSITLDDYTKTYNKLFPKTTVPPSARKIAKTEIWKLEVSAN